MCIVIIQLAVRGVAMFLKLKHEICADFFFLFSLMRDVGVDGGKEGLEREAK